MLVTLGMVSLLLIGSSYTTEDFQHEVLAADGILNVQELRYIGDKATKLMDSMAEAGARLCKLRPPEWARATGTLESLATTAT